ncbi:sugar ABC transporter substrate-binding protein [Halalkalibacter flavus]|uniref:sugar ABC transporter substrate-binding protein n=1 Tax=Halalkalibacter flavus TaxID=3090668 RepID=UPI002FC6288E
MKKLFVVPMVLMLMLILVACGGTESSNTEETVEPSGNEDALEAGSDEELKVAVVLQSLTSEYWEFVQAGARQAFEDFGVNGTILGPSSEAEIMLQVDMLQDVQTQGTDALVVSATQPDTVISTFERYKEDDIPVILINQDVDWEDKVTFIGTDNYIAGKQGGELLASMLQEGDEVALIGGHLGSRAHDDRLGGAKEALEAAGVIVASEQPADSDRSKAMSVMENILQSNPNLKGVFVSSDDMAMGALRGVQNQGVDIPVVGLDGMVENIESVIAGELAGTVAQNPYDMGYKGVEMAIQAIKGEEVEKRIDTGAQQITQENAQETLDFLKSLTTK